MSRKTLVLLPLIAIACTAIRVANAQLPPKTPDAFLKWSMDRYAKMKTFQAECTVKLDMAGIFKGEVKRMLWIAKPNRFRVVSVVYESNTIYTIVSDGTDLIERTVGSSDDAEDNTAPATLADAKSGYMQDNLKCGSMLYLFFGGAKRYSEMVNTRKSPIHFVENVTLSGVKCRTVKFWAQGDTYGNVEISIGANDGLVRRIRYDNQALLTKPLPPELRTPEANEEREKNFQKMLSPENVTKMKEEGIDILALFALIKKRKILTLPITENYTHHLVSRPIVPAVFLTSAP